MKRIRNITLCVPNSDEPLKSQEVLHEGEPTKYDAAGVVEGRYHTIKPLEENGRVFTLNEFPLTTITLLRTVLDNNSYPSRADLKTADRIFEKVPVNWKQEQPEYIELEDAEYEFVKTQCFNYKPYLNGRKFSPFLDAVENAATPE